MRYTVAIEYDDEILSNLGLSPKEFSEEAKLLLAAKLYEMGRLTSGQAAKFCGKGRVEFLMSLSSLGIPACNLRPEDAEAEIQFARHG